jgi:sortase A
MRGSTVIYWLTGIIFFSSFVFVVYSVVQITSATASVESTLREWEMKKKSFENGDGLVLDHSVYDDIDLGNTELGTIIDESALEETSHSSDQAQQVEVIGKLVIPKLSRELPIIYGTGTIELTRGVGYYKGSVFPGRNGNSILAGHRDSVFKGLGDVTVGDELTIQTHEGTLTYKVIEQKIVDEDDRTVRVSKGQPLLTLVTCYPFNFVGPAPQRYILTAALDVDQ